MIPALRDARPNVDRVLCAGWLYWEGHLQAAHAVLSDLVPGLDRGAELDSLATVLDTLAGAEQQLSVLRDVGLRAYLDECVSEDDWPRTDWPGWADAEDDRLADEVAALTTKARALAVSIAEHADPVEAAA